MTADKKFDLGADVVQALKTIVDANAAVFEDAAETLPRSRAQRASAGGPAANAPEEDRVFAWFDAMKPRFMSPFLWAVLFSSWTRHSGGTLELDGFARKVNFHRARVLRALRALERAGIVEVTRRERSAGAGRKTVSCTLRFSSKPRKGAKKKGASFAR